METYTVKNARFYLDKPHNHRSDWICSEMIDVYGTREDVEKALLRIAQNSVGFAHDYDEGAWRCDCIGDDGASFEVRIELAQGAKGPRVYIERGE